MAKKYKKLIVLLILAMSTQSIAWACGCGCKGDSCNNAQKVLNQDNAKEKLLCEAPKDWLINNNGNQRSEDKNKVSRCVGDCINGGINK